MSDKELTKYEKVWLDAWIAVAGVFNSRNTLTCTVWADKCLEAFKERFGNKKE